jgi:hypothetical protein
MAKQKRNGLETGQIAAITGALRTGGAAGY